MGSSKEYERLLYNMERYVVDMDEKLNIILRYLNIFYNKDMKMAIDISALISAVQNEKSVEDSVIRTMNGMSQQIAALAANVMDDATKAKLADLAQQINSNAASLAAAVSANTPASPVDNSNAAGPTTATDNATTSTPGSDIPSASTPVAPADPTVDAVTPAPGPDASPSVPSAPDLPVPEVPVTTPVVDAPVVDVNPATTAPESPLADTTNTTDTSSSSE